MSYMQRPSGIFVRQNMIPQSDLQAETTFPDGQYIEPGIGQVLSYPVGQNANGPRMLQTDNSGNLLVAFTAGAGILPGPTLVNLVPPRTDTVTVNVGPFTTPVFYEALFYVSVTAISGTSPSVTFTIQSQTSQGVWTSNIGGVAFSAITTVTDQDHGINPAFGSAQSLLGTSYRVNVSISGTSPSITWYMDLVYK